MNIKLKTKLGGLSLLATMIVSPMASATTCNELPDYSAFTSAVDTAFTQTLGFGFGLGMWATLMDTSGQVCHVYSVDGGGANGGADAGNTAWLGSRVISAQKANTANAFSLDDLSIPSGAVTVATYEGGSLYGLQHSNPVDATIAYGGSPNTYGTKADPLKNEHIGGINLFGGGIALYDDSGKVGAVGVSGDSSCRDAAMAFRVRANLELDDQPNLDGDALTLVPIGDPLTGLFQQPACFDSEDPDAPVDPNNAALYGVSF